MKGLSIHRLKIDGYAHLQVILGEEVAASKLTLFDLTTQICDAVQARAQQGLVEFIVSNLIFGNSFRLSDLVHYDQTSTMGSSYCLKG